MKILQANANLYPDQILIATVDKTPVGSIITSTITKLSVDASAEGIGQTVRKHLSLSKSEVQTVDFKSLYQEFLKAAGFKNAKAHRKAAKHLSIHQKEGEIVIQPTKYENGSFVGTKDLPPLCVNVSATDDELGKKIKEAWLKCVDNSV